MTHKDTNGFKKIQIWFIFLNFKNLIKLSFTQVVQFMKNSFKCRRGPPRTWP